MNAKELHDALSANPTSGTELAALAAANMSTILSALSLLAAAEASDGATPETDALMLKHLTELVWPRDPRLVPDAYDLARSIEAKHYRELRDHASRLERERNGLALAHADALEENARLRAEANDDDALRERMADILTRTAAALKGEPEPLTMHDWSGLPEIAERAVSELAKLRQHAEAMANAIQHGDEWDNAAFFAGLRDSAGAYRADFPGEK